jgi:hypothetical protein
MHDNKRTNLSFHPLCSTQHEKCVRKKGNRKLSLRLWWGTTGRKKGVPHRTHETSQTASYFTHVALPSPSFLPLKIIPHRSPVVHMLVLMRIHFSSFCFQNLKHTIASLTHSCYIFFSLFSAYISRKFNTPLKLTSPVIKTPSPQPSSGFLPWLPPVSLPQSSHMPR